MVLGTILASGKVVLGTCNSCNQAVSFRHLVAAFQALFKFCHFQAAFQGHFQAAFFKRHFKVKYSLHDNFSVIK